MKTATQRQAGNTAGVTPRAVAIGLILVVLNAYWLNHVIWRGLLHTYMSLFANTVFTLFLIVVLFHLLLKRVLPRFALYKTEALVIYVMVLMVSTVGGNTNMGYLVYILAHPFWFADAENDWNRLFGGYIPEWFNVQDRSALKGFYEGDSIFLTAPHIMNWLVPFLVWSAFVFVLYFVLICMNAVLRRQFSEHERLSYPIARLPLEIGKNPEAFFKNRLMWIGFSVAGGIEILNGVSYLYPSFPYIPIKPWDNIHLFPDEPWNALGTMLLSFNPFIIGLSFFMPLDLSFSALFFFFLGKALLVGRRILGWHTGFYLDEQAQGAWIGLGILALWVGRRHLKGVFTHAIGKARTADDLTEPMPYKWAIYGTVAGLIFITLFAYHAGISLWAVLLFFGTYFLMAIGLAKVRAGLGPPLHETIGKDPASTMVAALGTRTIGARNLTLLSFFFWLNRVNTAHPMPNQLEAFHIGRQGGINNRKLLWAMLIALAVGIPWTFFVYLGMAYDLGGGAAFHTVGIGWQNFNLLESRLSSPTEVDSFAMIAMGTGFGVTMLLSALKLRFLWWPLHPIGYVIGTGNWGDMSFIWLPVLFTWVVKSLLLRHGGLRVYRSAIPFFAGLILGDFVVGGIWSLAGIALQTPMYAIWTR